MCLDLCSVANPHVLNLSNQRIRTTQTVTSPSAEWRLISMGGGNRHLLRSVLEFLCKGFTLRRQVRLRSRRAHLPIRPVEQRKVNTISRRHHRQSDREVKYLRSSALTLYCASVSLRDASWASDSLVSRWCWSRPRLASARSPLASTNRALTSSRSRSAACRRPCSKQRGPVFRKMHKNFVGWEGMW